LATVRIYRVAELLNTSSQEVIALLKRDHGIEVKSASSTIEEVVARQFVERLARQRNISVPSNASFADTPVAAKGERPSPSAPSAPARPTAGPPAGRVVPPTLRLRVEDPRTGQAPPAPPRRPMLVRPPAPSAPTASQAPTGNLSRP